MNILLIQNDPTDAHKVQEALTTPCDSSFEVEWVRWCSQGLSLLAADGKQEKQKKSHIAAVLADLFLPDSRGIETFDKLFSAAPHIPILVLSSSGNEDVAKLAVQRGAQDYLLQERLDNYLLPKALRNMIERAANAEALFVEKERAQVTLNSIGDAVISTDVDGYITYLNSVAETITGWPREEAIGHALEDVFRIIDATTREPIQNPMMLAVRENKTIGLTPNCNMIRRDGFESPIEDSVAPIHDRRGHVIGAVMVFHDVGMARALSLRLSHLAQHDNLTDLPNRILFSDRLNQALALAQRRPQIMAVLFLDLDRFKHINDSLGHAIGDRLLRSVVQRLLTCVRSADTISRQGGDEFVILLSDMSRTQDAAFAAEKILALLRPPHVIDRHNLHVTVSIGIATYPEDGMTAETLMKNADIAMYCAKDTGRNNYKFFRPEMNVRVVERHFLENDLHSALEHDEFMLHYQPKMDLVTGTVRGVEALIRWHHPSRGLVPPTQFIPIAEDCGFIVPIGRWVMHGACRQARAWQDAGLPPMRIAVNISTVELRSPNFISSVQAIMRDTGLEPHHLELELTETFLMEDSQPTLTVLKALKDTGVHLALDDFGTGYSSLSYLKRFPIDTLKIDRSFVSDLTTDADDASIVNAVISMGKSLHMNVVAEGIETQQQLAFLRDRGCPEGQGYYFSEPLMADKFTKFLRDHRKPDGVASELPPAYHPH